MYTLSILCICGRLHHSFGHGNFRYIYLGSSVRQTIQKVVDALQLPIDKENLSVIFLPLYYCRGDKMRMRSNI